MTIITHKAGQITPTAVEGYRASRAARTIVADVANRSEADITFRAFGLRTGSFRLVFDGEVPALKAYAVLSTPQRLSISNTEVASLNMAFVVPEGRDLDIEQDDDVPDLWRIVVPFLEVKL